MGGGGAGVSGCEFRGSGWGAWGTHTIWGGGGGSNTEHGTIYIYTCVDIYMNVYIWLADGFGYMCIYIYIYIYICIHTNFSPREAS